MKTTKQTMKSVVVSAAVGSAADYVTFDDGLAKVKKWLVPHDFNVGTMLLVR